MPVIAINAIQLSIPEPKPLLGTEDVMHNFTEINRESDINIVGTCRSSRELEKTGSCKWKSVSPNVKLAESKVAIYTFGVELAVSYTTGYVNIPPFARRFHVTSSSHTIEACLTSVCELVTKISAPELIKQWVIRHEHLGSRKLVPAIHFVPGNLDDRSKYLSHHEMGAQVYPYPFSGARHAAHAVGACNAMPNKAAALHAGFVSALECEVN
jgi:hypothetical protein